MPVGLPSGLQCIWNRFWGQMAKNNKCWWTNTGSRSRHKEIGTTNTDLGSCHVPNTTTGGDSMAWAAIFYLVEPTRLAATWSHHESGRNLFACHSAAARQTAWQKLAHVTTWVPMHLDDQCLATASKTSPASIFFFSSAFKWRKIQGNTLQSNPSNAFRKRKIQPVMIYQQFPDAESCARACIGAEPPVSWLNPLRSQRWSKRLQRWEELL